MTDPDRKTLSLKGKPSPPLPPSSPMTAEKLDQLQAQLKAAHQEIKALKTRLTRDGDLPVMRGTAFRQAVQHRKLKERDQDHHQETDDSAPARLAEKGCLARIWLSNFSDIIKTHGDEIADDVILHTAQFLAGHIRETDIVGRLGISTFGILLGYADEQGAKAKLEKLISKLNAKPYQWKELTIPLNVRYDLMPLADMPQR